MVVLLSFGGLMFYFQMGTTRRIYFRHMQRQGAMVHMSDTQFNRVLRAMPSACGVFMACEVYTSLSFSVTNLVVYTKTLRLWDA